MKQFLKPVAIIFGVVLTIAGKTDQSKNRIKFHQKITI